MKEQLVDWNTFYIEGKQFHKTARGSVHRPEVFTPLIIENIAAMSIEKYFMAYFMHRGGLPHNHTLVDLLEEAQATLSMDPSLVESLRYMDSLQRICSAFNYSIIPPALSDVPRFLETLDAVARLVGPELDSVSPPAEIPAEAGKSAADKSIAP